MKRNKGKRRLIRRPARDPIYRESYYEAHMRWLRVGDAYLQDYIIYWRNERPGC